MRASARNIASVAAAVAALVAAGASAGSAQAAAFCSFTAAAKLTPGLSSTPTKGQFTTGGETGTLDCHGDLGGQQITGPGTLGFAGVYGTMGEGDTCAAGGGSGDFSLTVPTAGGSKHLQAPFTFSTFAGFGNFSSPVISGGFNFVPTEGNCFTAPVTAVDVYGGGSLSGM
jgi:hypothetical protein